MRITINDRCKIWEINDNNGTADIRMSANRKVRDKGYDQDVLVAHGIAKNGYVSSTFSFVRFVGHAYNKLKDIKIGDTIVNIEADLDNEPIWSATEQRIAYRQSPRLTVFNFDINTDGATQPKNYDRAPQVDTEATMVATFTPVENPSNAEDECPF